MSVESILDGLNPEQRQAVETTEGPLLVLAGAGSGKTRVLVHRIAYLVGVCGIAPEAILAVTFTNKAAGEMRERVQKLLGPEASEAWISTFHSACVRLLRREIGHLGLSRGFSIYDEGDALAVVKEALRRMGLDPKTSDPQRIRWQIDRWKNAGVRPAQVAEAADDLDAERLAEVYASYQRLLADADALDFGDLILHTTELFERFPQVLAHYQRRWQYLLVDEYQDTNRVQYKLLSQLAAEHRNICCVGDADQSVYAWRGADIRNILDFEREFPDAKVVKLERNYRSTRPILAGASGVVENNLARKERRLFTDRAGGELIRIFEAVDDREEASFVVREILAAVRGGDRAFGDFAVFYRTNAQSRSFEDELLKYDVPYVVVGGLRFYERAEVKDALAYLRILVNPKDDQGLRRIVNVPARGIGKGTVDRAAEIAAERGEPLLEGLRQLAAQGSTRSAPRVREFLALRDALANEVAGLEPADALGLVLDRSGYLRHLEREETPEAEARLENLRELLAGAEDFSAANAEIAGDPERSSLELFLDQVALVSDVDRWDSRADRVSLMTAHSAKGLEFPVVYLVGMEEGVFPHAASSRDDAGVEEERRLCYVGMTRAMERLTLTYARERRRWGSRSYGAPSRFLAEIPSEVVDASDAGRLEAPDASGPRVDYSYGQWEGDVPPIERGLRVRHPIFGSGTVVEVRGNGADQKLRILFDRAGVKTILVRYANLELG